MTSDNQYNQDSLNRLLLANGVAENYIDFMGNIVGIPLENRLRVLKEMGLELPDGQDPDAWLEEHTGGLLPATMILAPGSECIPLQATHHLQDMELSWSLVDEPGSTVSGSINLRSHDGKSSWSIPVPPLAPGYYRLHISTGEESASTFIIAAPGRAFEPEFLHQGRRLWGLSTQLFAMSSERNWGIGDFTDLEDLVDVVAAQGGHFILLNPLHALDILAPENASPYSPMDRRFLNPLYIDPARIDEYHSESFQQWLINEDITTRATTLRQSPDVLYTETLALKFAVFDKLYRDFMEVCCQGNQSREGDFLAFVEAGGASLKNFAEFEASRNNGMTASGNDPGFHLYLQWLASTQLDHVQESAREKGMQIGLVRDLAVGATGDSFEVIEQAGLFCRSASIGAPPDHFNPQGQNWGLTPMVPMALENSGFEHFIQLLRANMRACGALRLDHIMALMRLWWCPEDGHNRDGAYVHYNTDALFAILRLESQKAGCMIIGEDLGVVPPEIRGYIADSAILSNTIFYFDRYDGVSFKKPEHYNPRALAIITNHDVPTLKAWWNTTDLALRREIGLIEDDESCHREYETRARDKHCLLNMLADIHLIPGEWLDRDINKPFDLTLCTAIIRACARSVSSLVSLQLDDLAGLETPINIPGTSREYANWRRKTGLPVRELFAREDVKAMLAPFREERPE